MHLNKRLFNYFDFSLLIFINLIIIMGIINLFGSYKYFDNVYFLKQILWFFIALVLMVFFTLFNYRTLVYYSNYAHLFFLFLLILVLIVGKAYSGAKRWIVLGPLNFQPSEFTKISFILLLSKMMPNFNVNKNMFLFIIKLLITLFLTVFLVVIQPDLGTSIILILIFFTMIFFKLPVKNILFLLLIFICLIPFSWGYLYDYQKNRIIAFLYPYQNFFTYAYQTSQSKIAIGSGCFWGKGFGCGTQVRLNFLPEKYTDFAFSSWCEQFGFLGSFILIGLYLLIITKLIKVSTLINCKEGFYLVIGICANIFWQTFINISMTLGLLPVVGITLPLFSYGGSSLICCMSMFGIAFNVFLKRLE